MTKERTAINWENIDLNSAYERSLFLIDPLTFETLLLEIECNLDIINPTTVTKQFNDDLVSRIDEAWKVFDANLKNILTAAHEHRYTP